MVVAAVFQSRDFTVQLSEYRVFHNKGEKREIPFVDYDFKAAFTDLLLYALESDKRMKCRLQTSSEAMDVIQIMKKKVPPPQADAERILLVNTRQKTGQRQKSTTPERGGSLDGNWTGKTEQDKSFNFTVVKGRITTIVAGGRFSGGGCSSESETTTTLSQPIVNRGFSIQSNAGPNGMSMEITGRFTSATRASGTARLTLNGGCSGSIDTKWVAAKGDVAPSEELGALRKLAAGWLSLGGGGLGTEPVRVIVVSPQSPDTVYAATQWKMLKSVDAGKSFKAIGPDFSSAPSAIVIESENPSTLYAVGTEIFKSTDGGTNWQNLGRPGLAKHVALVIDPGNPNRLYLGGEHGWGIFLSTDGGLHWKNVLASSFVCCLAIDPKRGEVVYAGTQDYSSSKGGVLKSTDGGTNWIKILTAANLSCMATDSLNPDVVFVGTRGDGVLKSSDGGATWAKVNQGLTNLSVNTIVVVKQDPQTIYAGTEDGIYRSTDGARSWSPIVMPLPGLSVLSIAVDPSRPGGLYVGTSAGLFRKQ
jgi:photosystem II stability/assembly factor-like uncharacterized protein